MWNIMAIYKYTISLSHLWYGLVQIKNLGNSLVSPRMLQKIKKLAHVKIQGALRKNNDQKSEPETI